MIDRRPVYRFRSIGALLTRKAICICFLTSHCMNAVDGLDAGEMRFVEDNRRDPSQVTVLAFLTSPF